MTYGLIISKNAMVLPQTKPLSEAVNTTTESLSEEADKVG